MIVLALRARNLLKYARLELRDLPVQGRIAIGGPNESGKTAIGEIICFALFGRTFAASGSDLAKIVKWRESRANVEIDFAANDGSEYTVTRYLDSDGRCDARLARRGEADPVARGAEAVDGSVVRLIGFGYGEFVDTFYLAQREITVPHSQSSTVKSIVGVAAMERAAQEIGEEIKQEREAAERHKLEITNLNLQIMQLDFHEESAASLESELRVQHESMEEKRARIATLNSNAQRLEQAFAQLRRLADQVPVTDIQTFYAHWLRYADGLARTLDDLHRACHATEAGQELRTAADVRTLARELEEHLGRFVELQARASLYRRSLSGVLGESAPGVDAEAALPERQKALCQKLSETRHRQRRGRLVMWLFALVSLATWGMWIVVSLAPHGPLGGLVLSLTRTYVPAWKPLQNPSHLLWLAALAAAWTLLTLPMLLRTVALATRTDRLYQRVEELGGRIERLRKEAEILDTLSEIPLPEALAALRQIDDAGVTEAIRGFIGNADNPLLDVQALHEFLQRLRTSLHDCEAEVVARGDHLRESIVQLQREAGDLELRVDQTRHAIEDEREKRRRSQELTGLIRELHTKVAEHERRITVRDVAVNLLSGAAREVSARFNRDLQAYLPGIMPRLTDGRYRYLQIGDDYRLRVFSSEKSDFADLDELSSGTQRQITFALRLALAAALAQAAVRGAQCLILDEPFAFFDRGRMRETLAGLPSVSDRLTQIWVISQEFEPNAGFTLEIHCAPDQDTLTVKAA